MKYIYFVIFTFLGISSCCGTQEFIQRQTETNTPLAIVTAVPDVIETDSISETAVAAQRIDLQETVRPLPPKPPEKSSNYKEVMHKRWHTILQNHVSKNGNVDYNAIKNNKTELDIYIDYLSDNLPDNTWTKDEKLAYWINAYNALTVDLILRNYPIKSIKDIKDPWDQRLWKFGDTWYNLNTIEHEILRTMDEPRIHFAIVCASVSCPKLQNKAFTASNLEMQLSNATKEFLADTSKNKLSKDKIELSKIFKWFKKDFEQNDNLIDFLNQYSEVSISNAAKRSYTNYNWDLNG